MSAKPKPPTSKDWQTPARRLHLACKQSFIRVIKAALNDKDKPARFGDDTEANAIFERAVKAGEITERKLAGIGGVTSVYFLT